MLTSSPDIQELEYEVFLNLTTTTPVLTFINKSTMANPAGLAWVFSVFSPNGAAIHQGSFSAPDLIGGFTSNYVLSQGFPMPLGVIEWSGNPYTFEVSVKDSTGTVYTVKKQKLICRPNGNTRQSKDPFGKASVYINVQPQKGKVYLEDRTNYVYQNVQGVAVSKKLTLTYPFDRNGLAVAPKEIDSFSSVLVTFPVSGKGYAYYLTSIIDYALGDNVRVRLKYLGTEQFSVYGNIDPTPILCKLTELEDQIQNGTCRDAGAAQRLLHLVTAKTLTLLFSIVNPQTGIDPTKKIDEISRLTSWDCAACTSYGINASESAVSEVTGINYDIVTAGDITGIFEPDEDIVRLRIQDYAYNFLVKPGNTGGLKISGTTAGQLKTFTFELDQAVLSSELLTVIKGDANLLNSLNSLITTGLSGGVINVDGRCVFASGATCDYTFSTNAYNSASTKVKFLHFTLDDGSLRPLNFIFDGANTALLVNTLNALGIGTFAVSILANKATITSAANTTAIQKLSYQLLVNNQSQAGTLEAQVLKNCSPAGGITLSDFAQKMVNYVCDLTLYGIKMGIGVSIDTLDTIGGALQQQTFAMNTTVTEALVHLINSHNIHAALLRNTREVSTTTIENLFGANSGIAIDPTDFVYGNFNGDPGQQTLTAFASKLWDISSTNSAVKDKLCAAIAACARATTAPVANATATYNAGTTTLSGVITNVGALKYRIGYRKKGTRLPLAGVTEVTQAVGATTPYSFTSVPAGTYEVVITSITTAGDSGPFSAFSEECALIGSLSVVYNTNGTFTTTVGGIPSGMTKYRIEIAQPTGGRQNLHFLSSAPVQTITPPAGVYGDYTFTARTICDETALWFSAPSAPVTVSIPAPNVVATVTNVRLVNSGATPMHILADKPVGGATPTSYVLRLSRVGFTTKEYAINPVGSTLDWALAASTDVIHGVEYSYEIVSLAPQGESVPYSGGRFVANVGAASGNLSTVHNGTATPATSLTVLVNNSVVYAQTASFAAGATTGNFSIGNFAATSVRVTPCDAGATAGTLTSSGNTYPQSRVVGNDIYFDNVALSGGMTVNFT